MEDGSPAASEPLTSFTHTPTMAIPGLIRRVPTTLLVFEHPIHDATETIKRVLSRALVHYYPISGRIVTAGDDDHEAHIRCNGEGVAFVTGCALKKALELFDRSPDARMVALINELVVAYPAGGCVLTSGNHR
nr:acyl transferase 15-like [Setaria viridis]